MVVTGLAEDQLSMTGTEGALRRAAATQDPDLPAVVDGVLSGRADLVLGARQPQPGAWPVHARIANHLLAAEVGRRTGIRLRDLGPMRAAPRDALLGLGLRDRRFGWPLEMVIQAAARGWAVAEVPVTYQPRRAGRSKVTGTLKGTAQAAGDMRRVLRSCT